MPETQVVQKKSLLDGIKAVFLVPVLTIFVISKGLLSTIKGMTGELFFISIKKNYFYFISRIC